jgi:hypothetical protein
MRVLHGSVAVWRERIRRAVRRRRVRPALTYPPGPGGAVPLCAGGPFGPVVVLRSSEEGRVRPGAHLDRSSPTGGRASVRAHRDPARGAGVPSMRPVKETIRMRFTTATAISARLSQASARRRSGG